LTKNLYEFKKNSSWKILAEFFQDKQQKESKRKGLDMLLKNFENRKLTKGVKTTD